MIETANLTKSIQDLRPNEQVGRGALRPYEKAVSKNG